MELLDNRLPIEPDLQSFLAAAREAAVALGGGEMAIAKPLVELCQRLREAGAGTGYPLKVGLRIDDAGLTAHWGEDGQSLLLADCPRRPAPGWLERLRRRLVDEYQAQDPDALLHRNYQMVRRFEASRARMTRELELLQEELDRRQRDLQESIREAETDPLTHIYNRRAFDEHIGKAFQRTLRQGTESLSLLMIDLDYFKEVNDSHGHGYGDDYLRRTAGILGSVIRKDVDAAFRIGGDEFAVLLFANGEAACVKALQILQAMGERVSIGISSIEPGQRYTGSVDTFIQEADRALYEAKQAGRGRIARFACNCDAPPGGCTRACPPVLACESPA